MTASVSREETIEPVERSWSVQLLTKTERGRRNRRTIDSVVMATAALVLGLSAVIASSAPEHDVAVAHALTTVFGWANGLWQTLFVCLLALALVIVLDVLLRRRWDLVRDLVVVGLVLAGSAV